VFRKVYVDLMGQGVDLSEHPVDRKVEELMGSARDQIMDQVPKD
jgi:hypothetical protein